MLRVALFVAVSAAIVRLSWRSLSDPRSHGFYRFFAFEHLSALIQRNARSGFAIRSPRANWPPGFSMVYRNPGPRLV
jgi:hypothetical protein